MSLPPNPDTSAAPEAAAPASAAPVEEDAIRGGGFGSLFAEVRQLAEDGRTAAEAELGFQITRARLVAGSAAWLAGFGLAALIFALFALLALTLGLLLALASVVGPWWALAIVTGAWAALAAACLLLMKARWRRLSALAFGTSRK